VVDIVLAEYQGKTWLIRGERYIDDLLANTLAPDISIRIITCESESDFRTQWGQEDGRWREDAAPWLIHPGIANRTRAKLSGHNIYFGLWSALLDDEARAVIHAAAESAVRSYDSEIFLINYVDADAPPAMADLTGLRCTLIETELVGLGVGLSRINRTTRDAASDLSAQTHRQRLEIRIGSPLGDNLADS
jgi:hypothetical protein